MDIRIIVFYFVFIQQTGFFMLDADVGQLAHFPHFIPFRVTDAGRRRRGAAGPCNSTAFGDGGIFDIIRVISATASVRLLSNFNQQNFAIQI